MQRWLTPFLAELGSREAHLDQHVLQQAAALVVPGLQPDSHIGRVQHGFVQAPVAHQREAVIVNGTAAQETAGVLRWRGLLGSTSLLPDNDTVQRQPGLMHSPVGHH